MFESITGLLKEKHPSKAIVECNGIAYRIAIPLSSYAKLPLENACVFLYLCHIVREDGQFLYGFLNKEERDLFELLLHISGIGPRTAIGILGHMEAGAFERAIHCADVRTLSKLPGIGKKTAERLVLEMKDRFKNTPSLSSDAPSGGIFSDAVQALMNLGYPATIAQKAVNTVVERHPEKDLGNIILSALQSI